MNRSDSIAALAAALAKAQGEMKNPVRDATNLHFHSRYATLATVRDAVIPALSHHGIAVVQSMGNGENGDVACETVLLHSSGEWLSGTFSVPGVKRDPQGLGSATTYVRRYALLAMACVAGDDDDDGNAASEPERTTTPTDPVVVQALEGSANLNELAAVWKSLTPEQRAAHAGIKNLVKARLSAQA